MTNAPTRILVICTGNLCRSPLAHALLRDGLAQRGINAAVDSAGTGAPVGSRCDRRMRKAAKDLGCDMSEHRARQVTTADIDDADLVLVMNEEHLADLKRLGYGDVLDRAVSLRTAAWRAHVLDGQGLALDEWLGRLCAAPNIAPGDDVIDPNGGPLRDYREMAADINTLVGRLVVGWPEPSC